MKRFILAIMLFAAACGGSATNSAIPEGADLRADLDMKRTPQGDTVDISFYFARAEARDAKAPQPRIPARIDEVKLNDKVLTPDLSNPERPVYRTSLQETGTRDNTLTVKIGGREFIGKAQFDAVLVDRYKSIMLSPR
jgi:hypothetical protein